MVTISLIKRTLNNDLGYTTFVDTGIQIISDLIIFYQLVGKIFFVPYQLLSHPRMIPNLLPIGFAFLTHIYLLNSLIYLFFGPLLTAYRFFAECFMFTVHY